jgi:Mg2+ and Co2+ transporter CorA
MNLDHITPLDKIEKELLAIDEYMEITPSEQLAELKERLTVLAQHIARTGKILADAKKHLNEAKKGEIMDTLRDIATRTPFATPKTVNELISSLCATEQFFVDWAERTNRSCYHQWESCRSLLSLAKSEMIIDNQTQKA